MGSGFLEAFAAKDISVGGVGLFVPHGFEGYDIESQLEIVIKLPHAKPFLTKGLLRHKSGNKHRVFGISFVELSPVAMRALDEYIATRQR